MGDRTALFSVSNKHVADCGKPPHIDGDIPGSYYGYFEDAYGEQAVFVFDRQARIGTLWMGDNGWETPVSVIEGVTQGLVLDKAEAMWLKACWLAATAVSSS